VSLSQQWIDSIPPVNEVRSRLLETMREAQVLRQLLKAAESKERTSAVERSCKEADRDR
jgi:hypothetical protein